MPLEKFGSGRSLQSPSHFVPQRISTATLHAKLTTVFQIVTLFCQSEFISDSNFNFLDAETSSAIQVIGCINGK